MRTHEEVSTLDIWGLEPHRKEPETMRDQALRESGNASQGCSRPAGTRRDVDHVHRYLRLFPDDPEKSRTFPSPIEPASDDYGVEWKLRYAPQAMTREDQMYAASIVSAYAYLICEMTAKDRQSVVSEIRSQLAADRNVIGERS